MDCVADPRFQRDQNSMNEISYPGIPKTENVFPGNTKEKFL